MAFEINVNHRKKKKKSHCIAWQPVMMRLSVNWIECEIACSNKVQFYKGKFRGFQDNNDDNKE